MDRNLPAALASNTIPSLPPRLVALAGALGTVQHPGQPVRFNLPEGWAMSPLEREQAASLLLTLTSNLSADDAFGGEQGSMARGALLTKMIRGLAGPAETSEVAATSKIEMYADAVEDLPAWALDLAIKRWARGSCPPEIEDRPRYAFPPAPATLRELCLLETKDARRDAAKLRNLLDAVSTARAMDPTPLPTTGGVPALRRM